MPRKFLTYGDKGERVKRLQRALNRSPYFKPKPQLVVDGELGPRTCAVIQDAKYRMGYAAGDIDPDVKDQVAGGFLFDLLEGKRELPERYVARRKARLKKIRAKNRLLSRQARMRRAALKVIKGEIGTLEQPSGANTNRIRYNTWWGWGAVEYCVIGLSWAWVKVGSVAFKRGSRWANTDVMLTDAKAGRNGLHLTSAPKAGCPGVIDWEGHSDPDHAITFVRWKDAAKRIAVTAEFNTRDNRGLAGVWMKERPAAQCWWFEVEK
jgi:peptidoglycan hydrolase-like protein with peptidoglycan-binding domain